MSWSIEDWEYPNDEVYAIERQKDIEASWRQWEEDNNRKPAIIKVITPIKNEAKRKSKSIRRARQKRL